MTIQGRARVARLSIVVILRSLLFRTMRSIVAIGTSGFGLDGGNLIGDAADGEGAALGAVAPQFLHDVFVIVRADSRGRSG